MALLLEGISREPVRDGMRLSPTRLADLLGFSRPTARKAIAQLRASLWFHVLPYASGAMPNREFPTIRGYAREPHEGASRSVRMPTPLLLNAAIDPAARVLYGVLQSAPGFRHPGGTVKYATLGDLTGRDTRTLRRLISELTVSGWLQAAQAHRKDFLHFTLLNPVAAESEHELARTKRQIGKGTFLGETIMRAYLSLIVDSQEFEDDAAPGFLVNPLTDERLQFDRYYPPNVAFEFNGPQHYGPTELYTAKEASAQRARDLIKVGLCADRGITLVVVHPEDLSLAGMMHKVNGLLPVRNLEYRQPVIDYLESISRPYRRAARRRGVRPVIEDPNR